MTLVLQVTTNVSLLADNGVKYPARHKIRAIALSDADLVSCRPLQYSLEFETKVKQMFAKVSIVSYSLMIIVSASQFYV